MQTHPPENGYTLGSSTAAAAQLQQLPPRYRLSALNLVFVKVLNGFSF